MVSSQISWVGTFNCGHWVWLSVCFSSRLALTSAPRERGKSWATCWLPWGKRLPKKTNLFFNKVKRQTKKKISVFVFLFSVNKNVISYARVLFPCLKLRRQRFDCVLGWKHKKLETAVFFSPLWMNEWFILVHKVDEWNSVQSTDKKICKILLSYTPIYPRLKTNKHGWGQ